MGIDKVLVAFTGTQIFFLPETVLIDLEIGKVDFPPTGGNVSQGFYAAWMGVSDLVLSRINNSTKEVWLSGHSLGGALITIASAVIKRLYPQIKVITYSYSSPRVGDAEFAFGYSQLGIKSNRIQNNLDLIPSIPLIDFLGYHHVHTLILLCQNTETEITKCIYNAKEPDNYVFNPFDWPVQHSLATYMKLISSCIYCPNRDK